MSVYTQEYVRIGVTESTSKIDGNPLFTVEFAGVEDSRVYMTYVQATMRNWKLWKTIIDNPNPGVAFSLHEFQLKDPRRGLVNADSKPELSFEGTLEELARGIDLVREHLRGQTNNPNFDNLFEMERL